MLVLDGQQILRKLWIVLFGLRLFILMYDYSWWMFMNEIFLYHLFFFNNDIFLSFIVSQLFLVLYWLLKDFRNSLNLFEVIANLIASWYIWCFTLSIRVFLSNQRPYLLSRKLLIFYNFLSEYFTHLSHLLIGSFPLYLFILFCHIKVHLLFLLNKVHFQWVILWVINKQSFLEWVKSFHLAWLVALLWLKYQKGCLLLLLVRLRHCSKNIYECKSSTQNLKTWQKLETFFTDLFLYV